MNILKENPGIMDSNEKVTWDRWEWGPNERLNSHRLDQKPKTTSKKELIEMYLSDLHAMSYHLFSYNWNCSQFLNIKKNLKEGAIASSFRLWTELYECVSRWEIGDRRAHYDH